MSMSWYDLQQSVRDEIRDEADALMDDAYPEDRLTEMVDSWVPVYSSELLDLAADNNELAINEPEILAFDGAATPINAIAGNVYEGLMAVAYAEWDAIQDEREDADND